MLLEKTPVPVPSVVFSLLVVGSSSVPQHTPLSVICPPPSEDIFPPETAVDPATEVTLTVVNVASEIWLVVNDTWFPYPVPASLVA